MKKLYCLLTYALFFQFAMGQQTEQPYYHTQNPIAGRTTGYSGTGGNIDVVYHRMEWRINPDSAKAIKGKVTTRFKTTQPNVSAISFDLRQSSFNNANLVVTYHGITCARTLNASNILSITLPSTITATNTLDSVVINYYGVPPAVTGQAEGYQLKTVATFPMIYTLSESYEDRDWWPCKADMQDRIDSMDIIISTPTAHTATTNGVLVSTVTSGASRIFTFKHRYPIPTYLVAVGVTRYNKTTRSVTINGKAMPVEYFISQGRSSTATAIAAMDKCLQELVVFSEKFGEYPFINEKYGMYEFGWGGGMEHQTNSAMSWGAMSSAGTIAHELVHQWFGDKVTFSTWNHLWLAEGFARYGEAMAAEFVTGTGNALSIRQGFKAQSQGTTLRGFSCYIPNASMTTSNAIWSSAYGSSVYERGAMVVSMLRTLLGDDKFFEACRNYLDDPALAYKSASTQDLQDHMEAVLGGYDLTPFFNAYVYGTGFPTTSVNWFNPSNGRVLNIAIASQSRTSAGSTTYFPNVIPLRVQGAGGEDTMIVIYDINGNNLGKAGRGITAVGAGNVLSYSLSFVPTSVTFDPYANTLSNGTASKLTVLDLRVTDFTVQPGGAGNNAQLTLDGNSLNSAVILERSGDGVNYSEVGDMTEQVATSTEKRYFLQDAKPLAGTNYYRAKYKNASGVYVYSKVVTIGNSAFTYFKLLNNPAISVIRLSNPAGNFNKPTQFGLYDMAGKQVLKYSTKIAGGVTEIKLPTVTKGIYVLEIKHQGTVQVIKVNIN